MTTNETIRHEVLTLHKLNLPGSKRKPKKLSHQHIADELGIKRRTVSNIIKQSKEEIQKKRKGPAPKLDAKAVAEEIHASKTTRTQSNSELAEKYGVSIRTLQKTLKKEGVHSYKRRRKPFINENNRIKRMHMQWNMPNGRLKTGRESSGLMKHIYTSEWQNKMLVSEGRKERHGWLTTFHLHFKAEEEGSWCGAVSGVIKEVR